MEIIYKIIFYLYTHSLARNDLFVIRKGPYCLFMKDCKGVSK